MKIEGDMMKIEDTLESRAEIVEHLRGGGDLYEGEALQILGILTARSVSQYNQDFVKFHEKNREKHGVDSGSAVKDFVKWRNKELEMLLTLEVFTGLTKEVETKMMKGTMSQDDYMRHIEDNKEIIDKVMSEKV